MTREEKLHIITQIRKEHDIRGFGGILLGDILHIANVIVSNTFEGDYTETIEELEKDICSYWAGGDMRLSIEKQTTECIDFIYSLVKDG